MKKITSILITVILICTFCMPITVFADSATSGTSGEINWSIDGKTLTISAVPGTSGRMDDYDDDYPAWYYAPVDDGYAYEKIDYIVINEEVSYIGSYAFSKFSELGNVKIPSTCQGIGQKAFYNCDKLYEVSLWGNVDYKAFAYCDRLTNVTVNGNCDHIGEAAFYDCEKLRFVDLTANRIEKAAFCYCYEMEQITINEGCTFIGNEAFYCCYDLKKLLLPSTISTIEREAFYYCINLEKITYWGTPTSLNNALDPEYNDVIIEAMNFEKGRAISYIVSFISPNGNITEYPFDTLNECKNLIMDGKTTTFSDGWYIVNSELDFGLNRLEINGDVNIILFDNCGIKTGRGIHVCEGKTLTIYSQSIDYSENSKMGYIKLLLANSDDEEISNGCSLIGSNEGQNSCTINIYGGFFSTNFNKYSGSVIGSGENAGSSINITNGIFKDFTTNYNGAAIGGSDKPCSITINGGYFENIHGGEHGAGIGGGNGTCVLTINGGDFHNIEGGDYAAGIGGGGNDCTLTINGGNFDDIRGGKYSVGIGGATNHHCVLRITGGEFKNIFAGVEGNNNIGAGNSGSIDMDDDTRAYIANHLYQGFTLSGGNLCIIILGAVVIFGAIVAMIIVTKKSKKF